MQKLSPADIRIGVPLPFSVFDKEGRLLLRKGVVITYPAQIERLLANGLYMASGKAAPPCAVEEKAPPVFDEIGSLTLRLKTLFTALLGTAPPADIGAKMVAMAREIHAACERDGDAALAAVHLDFHNPYLLAHHVHSAVLCSLLGRRLNLANAELAALMCAALTYDISLVDMPHLEKQMAPLNSEQGNGIRRHPQRSVEILKCAGITNETWLTAISCHHERIDGSGYPQGLGSADLAPGARILGLVDCYTAMIKGRPYRDAKVPLRAISEVLNAKAAQFDATLCDALVKELGMYPPGALVRLANGETGVIKERGVKIHAPQVYSIYDTSGIPLMVPRQRDVQLEQYAIKAPLAYSEYRAVALIMRRLWTT